MNWRELTDRVAIAVRDTFGESIEYRAVGFAPVQIKGIYDQEFESVDPDTGAPITTTQNVLAVRVADLPRKPKVSDTLVRAGISFRVVDIQEDGHGMARLLLHK